MKSKFKNIFILFSCCILHQCTPKENNTTNEILVPTKSTSHMKITDQSLYFLQNIDSNMDVKNRLLNNSVFNQRMLQLLSNRYSFLISKWTHHQEVKHQNHLAIIEVCEKLPCNKTDFIIVYDFQMDKFSVGIRENGIIETFSESTDLPEQIIQWTKH